MIYPRHKTTKPTSKLLFKRLFRIPSTTTPTSQNPRINMPIRGNEEKNGKKKSNNDFGENLTRFKKTINAKTIKGKVFHPIVENKGKTA
jgi:hypothetical protein